MNSRYAKEESNMLKVNVITTGGTIEKIYSEQTSTVENLDNQIHRYLGRLRLPDCDVRVVPLMNKDSLEMTDADHSAILGLIEQMLIERPAVVISHGTDTMVQTGRYLKQALPELKIPMVLTGAILHWSLKEAMVCKTLRRVSLLFGYLLRVFMS